MQSIGKSASNQSALLRLLVGQMGSLYEERMSLVPLGGEDGKSPLVYFQDRKRLPFETLQQKLINANSNTYGIRLQDFTVVDIDKDDVENREYVKKRFGTSPLSVKTPRGLHIYFAGETSNEVIRKDNIAVDIKSGSNSYVVGAGSIRPDGGAYSFISGDYSYLKQLPEFKDNFLKNKLSQFEKITEGHRFKLILFPKAIEFATCCDSLEELIQELRSEINLQCENPETITRSEIQKVAKWAWEKRLQNSLYSGENSAVKTTNQEFKILMRCKDSELGLALLHILRHNHSAKNRIGKPFPICRRAMAKANIIEGWSEGKYRRASLALLKAGLIKLVKRGGKNSGANLYQLNSLLTCK